MKRMGEPVKMGEDNCPYCGYTVDHATSTRGDGGPKPHDLSICLKCGNVMEYGEDFALQKFPQVLFDELPEEVKYEIKMVQEALKMAKAKMN